MSSYQYIYVMKDLSKSYPGGKEVLKHIWLSFFPGAKIGVLGVNGSGKSTLMKIMAGLDTEFSGEAWASDGVTIGYLPQEPILDTTKTVLENVLDGAGEVIQLLKRFEEVSLLFSEPDADYDALIAEQSSLQERIDSCNGWEIEHFAKVALSHLGCPPADSGVQHLSGGEKRRIALCRLLLSRPDMLLLDEPTNHLDAEAVLWLEQHLKDYKGTVVMVTHDRYFLDNVTGWILELDRGEGIPYEGNYTTWLSRKQERLEQEAREESSRKKAISAELEWIRQSPKARQAKSKARITAFDELVSRAGKVSEGMAQIVIPSGDRLGNEVIEVEHLSKSFNGRTLISDLSFRVPAGAIVGIIGPNGSGKTTFMKMITGQEKPDSGLIKIGETVRLGYVDQSRDSLDDSKTVWEEISEGSDEILLDKRKVSSRAYVGQFNFKGSDQQKKVGVLSGGERNRVHLAKMLKKGSNVILLDEPTNDLDIDTLRALEQALNDFAGTAFVSSHDRWFLDRVVTHILAFEGEGKVTFIEGNFEDYEADKTRRGVSRA